MENYKASFVTFRWTTAYMFSLCSLCPYSRHHKLLHLHRAWST